MGATPINALAVLSDRELTNQLEKLVCKERITTLEILLHLIEVERRKLHLAEGCRSLFDYCLRRLGYPESAANRRIRTARCIRDFPDVHRLLVNNRLSLSTVSLVAGILTHENQSTLLAAVCKKTHRQVEAVVSQYRPQATVRDRVKPVGVKPTGGEIQSDLPTLTANVETIAGGVRHDLATQQEANERAVRDRSENRHDGTIDKWQEIHRRAGGKNSVNSMKAGRDENLAAPLPAQVTDGNADTGQNITQRFKIEFGVGLEFMEKFERIKALFSTKYPRRLEFAVLFETLMDTYLARYDWKERAKRRELRKRNTKHATQPGSSENEPTLPGDRESENARGPKERLAEKHTRYIAAAVRDEVYRRDGGQCAYMGPTGVRCNSTWNLQVDHIVPHAEGGNNEADNLRLLCAHHNRLEAERIYGKGFMDQFGEAG